MHRASSKSTARTRPVRQKKAAAHAPARKMHQRPAAHQRKQMQMNTSLFKTSKPARAMKFDASQGLTEEQLMFQVCCRVSSRVAHIFVSL